MRTDGRRSSRAAAAASAARGLDVSETDFTDPALRDEATGRAAGVVAANPQVREALVDLQRGFAAAPPDGAPGAVLDGRDIGTVICPDADYKFFIDADIEVRAQRRVKELQEKQHVYLFQKSRAHLTSNNPMNKLNNDSVTKTQASSFSDPDFRF